MYSAFLDEISGAQSQTHDSQFYFFLMVFLWSLLPRMSMLLGSGLSLKYTQSYSETSIINAELVLDLP